MVSIVKTIILLGDGGVGKSSLIMRYISDRFMEEYDPTIEESFYKNVDTTNGPLKLEILDTAGQDDFSAIRQEYYRKADGVIGVFDVNNLMTFIKLKDFWQEIIEERSNDKKPLPPIIVAGNKIDVDPKLDFNTDPNFDDVKQWLTNISINNSYVNIDILYTSAKNDKNVNDLFIKIIDLIINIPSKTLHNPEPHGKKNKCILF